jgi:hypothetical protein
MSDVNPKKYAEPNDYAHEVAVLEHLDTLKNYSKIVYPQQNDIKRCATAIRFLLLEKNTGLKKSAKLWAVPLLFNVHDIEPLVWQAKRGYVKSYTSSYTRIFGSNSGAFAESHPYRDFAPYQYDIEKRIPVNLDVFLAQLVVFSEGMFFSRKELIDYICYGTGAIHYDKNNVGKISKEKILAFKNLDKNILTTTMDPLEGPVVTFILPDSSNKITDFKYTPSEISPVFFEFHATINKINESDSIKLLSKKIQTKLNELSK